MSFFSNRFPVNWNIGDIEDLFLRIKPIIGLYHVVVTFPKTDHEKNTLTVVEMQQLPHIQGINSIEDISYLK